MNASNWLWITPFAFILFMKLLALFSGWEQLASKYRLSSKFEGRIYRGQSARVKWTNYNGCINVGVNAEGLYLAPFLVFRLFHKPLLIPWTEINALPTKKWLVKGYKLKMESCSGLSILLYGNLFARCLNQLDSSLREAVLLTASSESED